MIKQDRRVERTRAALVGAVNHLLLARRKRQRNLTVADIASTANVGRSTLYEHFPNADAVYLEAARRPFGTLADAITGAADDRALTRLLEHFWENRQLARDTFVRLDSQVSRMAAEMVEERLIARGVALSLPIALAALQLTEAALAPIRGWVTARAPCTPDALGRAIARTSDAMLKALAI